METEKKEETIKNSEVQKITPTKNKKIEFELANVLRLFSLGFTKKYIRNKLGISTTNFSYYLGKLEDSGCILRKGKYEVQVLRSSIIHPRVTRNIINSKFNKRGHAFNMKIIFPEEKDIREKPLVKELFNKRDKNKPEKRWLIKLPFGSFKMVYKKYTIWINKDSLTIYSNNSYYSDDALLSKFGQLKDVDLLIRYLKNKFNFKGIYGIEVFREHYGLIFNKFAEWILSKGRKMEVKDKGNKSILWVDDSMEDDIGLKEFEGKNARDINNADKFFESQEETNWEMTPKVQIKIMNGIQNNQKGFAEQMVFLKDNLKTHFNVLDKIGNKIGDVAEQNRINAEQNQKLGDIILSLADEVKRLREEKK